MKQLESGCRPQAQRAPAGPFVNEDCFHFKEYLSWSMSQESLLADYYANLNLLETMCNVCLWFPKMYNYRLLVILLHLKSTGIWYIVQKTKHYTVIFRYDNCHLWRFKGYCPLLCPIFFQWWFFPIDLSVQPCIIFLPNFCLSGLMTIGVIVEPRKLKNHTLIVSNFQMIDNAQVIVRRFRTNICLCMTPSGIVGTEVSVKLLYHCFSSDCNAFRPKWIEYGIHNFLASILDNEIICDNHLPPISC